MELKINNLTYEKENIKIIDNFNYTFKQSTVTSIIGASGSGKSTLFDLINYLNVPTKGSISFSSFKITKDVDIKNINDLRKTVGLLFQEKEESFFQDTVYKEISFALNNFNYKKENIKKRVSDSLKIVGLDDSYLDKNPFNLSYGEKTKIALAILLAPNPKIILLDEPTIGLDCKSKNMLIKIIEKLKKLNKIIIINSNDIEFINEVSDDIIVLNKGSIILSENKENLFNYISSLEENNIEIPHIIEFIDLVRRIKKINLNLTLDIEKLVENIKEHV